MLIMSFLVLYVPPCQPTYLGILTGMACHVDKFDVVVRSKLCKLYHINVSYLHKSSSIFVDISFVCSFSIGEV